MKSGGGDRSGDLRLWPACRERTGGLRRRQSFLVVGEAARRPRGHRDRVDRSPAIVGLDYSARNPDGFLPYGMMSDVDVDDKWIYVSDDGINQVWKFRKKK